ncbi:MAG TPA: sigma-70 family RNA polymerase sigma factor [Gemmatimonadaceae bacterium]|nr:sigma-70 family RNA polymerase sigma factor [Gemmatimonadaceae bacterium]
MSLATDRVARSPVRRLRVMTGAIEPARAPAPEPTDTELVARARLDDPLAAELLVRRHYRAVFAVARAMLDDAADAEDICHDALVRALSRLEDCQQPERFAQWAAAIARNLARNHLAHPSVRRAALLDERLPSAGEPASQRLAASDLCEALDTALAQLTTTQREVVLLHDLHDWTHETIGEWLGTSAGMSRQHLFKARRQLREALGPNLLREYFDE